MTISLKYRGVVCLVVAVAVVGCGGHSQTSVAAADGSAAGADSNPGLGGTPVSDPSKPRGYLSAEQSSTGANRFAYTLLGTFWYAPGRFDRCMQKQLGACSTYYDCPSVTSANPVDVGALSATGASGTIPIPHAGGSYAAAGQAELWSPLGGSLTFIASGSVDVPPFTLTVAAPPSVLLTAFNGAPAPSSLIRGAGAKLQWNSVDSGNVTFELDSDDHVRPQTLVCQFPASAGAGEVSATALSTLTSGFYLWHLEGTSTAEVEDGAWHIEATAAGFGSEVTGQEIQIQ